MRKTDRSAPAPRISVHFVDVVCLRRREFSTMRACSSKSLIPCIYAETIRANQVTGHFAHFVLGDQHGIIAKHFTLLQNFVAA